MAVESKSNRSYNHRITVTSGRRGVYSADGNYEVSYKPNVVVFHSGDVLWNITSYCGRPQPPR